MDQRPTARVILLNNENKILLLKILERGTFWIAPGGKIEEGETPLEAAVRELYEETGITTAEFVTPPSWYCETIAPLHGVLTLFKEYYFLTRTQNSQTTDAYLNEDEKQLFGEYKWWDLHALIKSGETFYPKELVVALAPIVYHNHKPPLNTITLSC
jgi:8-oxo-dGTP pyrophosphatase MutT (NUDIX family)